MGILDNIRQGLPPEDGVIYCAFCNNLNAASYVRFCCPSIEGWDGTDEARDLANAIAPGYGSAIQMDRVLRYLQAKDPLAYLIFNGIRKPSVRACTYVAGFAVCAQDAGWLLEQWRTTPLSRSRF